MADGEERLLIGTTRDGVLVSDGKTVREEPLFAALKGHVVRSMTRMTTGLLWFGTSNGVFACAPQQACNVAVPNVDARVVFPVLDDNVSEIWCGTRGNGLLRIRLDPVFDPWSISSTPNKDCRRKTSSPSCHFTPDSNSQSVLIATNRGVARYMPGTSHRRCLDAHTEQTRARAVGTASRTRSRVSAEQFAARRNRDQQPHLSGTVSICVRVRRRLREASKT